MTASDLWTRVTGWWRRAAALPTAVHLFCAEMELRRSDGNNHLPAARAARQRTLDALRAYRRRREFPRNTSTAGFIPCFIDADGRRCAVAAIMEDSGHAGLAQTVAREANLGRIRDMRVPGLGEWAAASGLTPSELARVQPSYPPTPEQLRAYEEFVRVIWVLVTLGIASIVLNGVRLLWGYTPRWPTTVAGLVIGAALIYYGLVADGPRGGFRRPLPDASLHQTLATAVGVIAALFGAFRLMFDRGRVRPPAGTPPARPRPAKLLPWPAELHDNKDPGAA